jgi:hypothetical protein
VTYTFKLFNEVAPVEARGKREGENHSNHRYDVDNYAEKIEKINFHNKLKEDDMALMISYNRQIATAAANLARHDGAVQLSSDAAPNPRLAAGFYLAGLISSLLHMPFGPGAMRLLEEDREDKGAVDDVARDNMASVMSWVGINTIRGCVADFPSWACYFVAFMFANSGS